MARDATFEEELAVRGKDHWKEGTPGCQHLANRWLYIRTTATHSVQHVIRNHYNWPISLRSRQDCVASVAVAVVVTATHAQPKSQPPAVANTVSLRAS